MAFLEFEGGPDYEGAGPALPRAPHRLVLRPRGRARVLGRRGDPSRRPGNFRRRASGRASTPSRIPGPARCASSTSTRRGITDYIARLQRRGGRPSRSTCAHGARRRDRPRPRRGRLLSASSRDLRQVRRAQRSSSTTSPGFGPIDPHVHDDARRLVLRPRGRDRVHARRRGRARRRPGTLVAAPPGARHGFRNSSARRRCSSTSTRRRRVRRHDARAPRRARRGGGSVRPARPARGRRPPARRRARARARRGRA